MFRERFELGSRFFEFTTHRIGYNLSLPETMLRKSCLLLGFEIGTLYLGEVSFSDMVYASVDTKSTFAAFARLSLGKLGYIGDIIFSEEV
jgi:hypothetical protein